MAAATDVLHQTLLQVSVANEQRGRAMGSWIIGTGIAPVGHLEVGTLASLTSTHLALLANGLALMILTLGMAICLPGSGGCRRGRTSAAHRNDGWDVSWMCLMGRRVTSPHGGYCDDDAFIQEVDDGLGDTVNDGSVGSRLTQHLRVAEVIPGCWR